MFAVSIIINNPSMLVDYEDSSGSTRLLFTVKSYSRRAMLYLVCEGTEALQPWIQIPSTS